MNQFFYKRTIKNKDGTESEFYDCFNLSCVIRGFWAGDNKFVLLLNDGHEISEPTYKKDNNGKLIFGKNNLPVEEKRTREWVVSQIELVKEDAIRFREICEMGDNYYCNESQPTGEKMEVMSMRGEVING